MMRALLKRVLAAAALTALAATAQAQSAFQDAAKGESSVFIKDGGGFVRINPTDKSIDLGYLRDRGDERWYFGLDAKGKASGTFASLFSGGTPSPEAELGFTFGKRFVGVDSDDEIINACIGETQSQFKPAEPPKPTPAAVEEYVKAYKEKRVPILQKELAKGDKIKKELIAEAKAEGASDTLAKLYAHALAPTRAEEQAGVIAEQEARDELAAAALAAPPRADAEQVKKETEQKARTACLREEPRLIRRVSVDWLSFRTTYNRAQYNILNEASAFGDQVRKQNFDGYSATVAYNALLTFDNVGLLQARRKALRDARVNEEEPPKQEPLGESKGSMILGVSLGVRRTNNSGDLKSVEVEDQVFASASESTQRRAVSKQTVLRGEYDEYMAVPLNTDVVVYPGVFRSRIAIDFFTRSNLGKTNREFIPGVGLFVTQENKPTKVVGGISFALDDGKARVGLVGGFHF